MSKKHHGGPGPVPPGNRSQGGTKYDAEPAGPPGQADYENADASFQEQDPKRRLGDFSGAGEHPRQQPSDLNDGTKHSK